MRRTTAVASCAKRAGAYLIAALRRPARGRLSRFGVLMATCLVALSASSAQAASRHSKRHAARDSLGQLVAAGTLHFCSDISSPPLEFFQRGTTPAGSDIDVGDALAKQLHLKPVWVNTVFSGIIPALEAGHCDVIMSQLFIKPARLKVINMVHYMNSHEALMVRRGNPLHIGGINDLCGRNVAAETGTTVALFLAAANKKCLAHHKAGVSVQTFLRDSDAVEQLGLKHVDAYGTTLETGSYDISKNKGEYQFAGKPFDKAPTGIGIRKNDPQLTHAIQRALKQIRKDGTYRKIFTEWGLKGDMIR